VIDYDDVHSPTMTGPSSWDHIDEAIIHCGSDDDAPPCSRSSYSLEELRGDLAVEYARADSVSGKSGGGDKALAVMTSVGGKWNAVTRLLMNAGSTKQGRCDSCFPPATTTGSNR